jgi:hypothetical protein
LALIYDIAVPVEAETIERAQDAVRTARYQTWCIQILDADEPLPIVVSRIEIAADCRQQ